MSTVLLTGATGLVGANLCRLAAKHGVHVRALVRSKNPDTSVLEQHDVDLVVGDVLDGRSLREAADGVDGVIHAAAVVGGTWATAAADEFMDVNFRGTVNVLDACDAVGVPRVVLLSTYGILDYSVQLTETSPIVQVGPHHSPYLTAKLAAYYEGMARASAGRQHVCFVVPGCIYGPSPLAERALVETSFNMALLKGLTGQLSRYLAMQLLWVHADDVAQVALGAFARGKSGHRYLATGMDESLTLAQFCNLGAELAGTEHRVADDALDTPDSYGSMSLQVERARRGVTVSSEQTRASLRICATRLGNGLAETVAWLGELGKLG
jgi:nucleoside-diphosphate-sugar epimerase